MLVIPSIDLTAGRSRIVWWPGAGSGTGAPTDRPERIARSLVEAGASMIHLVDLDGARAGQPEALGAIAEVSRAVAVPLQVSGGVDGPEQVELVFAAGATRAVVPLWAVVEDRERLDACLAIAGDWLAVGLDARPERLRDYPWKRYLPPTTLEEVVGELAAAGVRRFVLSHAGASPDAAAIGRLRALDVELAIAGGVPDMAAVERHRVAGIDSVIVGEAVFTGAVSLRPLVPDATGAGPAR
jgi:phosphoribosylformimino-5-aminoimidazole carboxamide ribotide isomerase